MAEYTKEDYLRKLEMARNAQDLEAVQHFENKIKEIDATEKLFNQKSQAIANKDDEAIAHFNKRIQNETKFGDTGLSGGDLIFENLNRYEGYNDALISYYSKENNRPRFGNVDAMYDRNGNWIGNEDDLKALKEKNFEYWNATTLNVLQMGETALELSKMSDGEKDVAKTLYETYEKTKITGEGSRNGFEQMKDAWHLIYDPTTWMGGKWLMSPIQKAATRKGIMLALTKGRKAPIKNKADRVKLKLKLREGERTRDYAKKTSKFVGPRTAEDEALHAAKVIASQRATADRAKFSLKKKLLQDGLSQQEANAVLKAAGKSVTRRSAALGAGYTGSWDAGLQTGIQNQLDPEREFSWMQSGAATGLGAAFGGAIPKAGKFASWAVQKPGSIMQNTIPKTWDRLRDPLSIIRDPIVKSLGGKKAARVGVAEEAEAGFRSQTSKGSAEAAEDAVANLQRAKSEGFDRFDDEYKKLGNLESKTDPMGEDVIRKSEDEWFSFLENPTDTLLTRQLKDLRKSINEVNSPARAKDPIYSLDFILKQIETGNLTPTQALREFRKEIRGASKKANESGATDRRNLKVAKDRVQDLFTSSAKRAGKEAEAAKVDARFSEFAKTTTDPKITSLTSKASDTQRQMKAAISAGNSSLIREHLKNIKTISKFSDTPAATYERHMDALRDVANEIMFSGQTATTFKRYLSNKDGIGILKQIYPRLDEEITRLAKIQRNAEAGGTVGMFAMRLMTTAVASIYGFGIAGPMGSALVGGSGYIIVEKMLSSKTFQKMAMKTFSKEPTRNASQLLATAKWFQKRFPKLSPDEVNKIGNIVFGGSLWAYVLSESDDLNGKIRGGIKFAGDTGQDVLNFLSQEGIGNYGGPRRQTSENLDQVAQQLGVTNLPGFKDNAASSFQQSPSWFNQ